MWADFKTNFLKFDSIVEKLYKVEKSVYRPFIFSGRNGANGILQLSIIFALSNQISKINTFGMCTH